MLTLRLGTRGSPLALYQARAVAARLASHGGVRTEIVVIKTSGDRLADAALSEIGGKRLFVKEIEDALQSGDIDLAVHSSKDMPAVLPDGLDVGAVLEREDARDAVVLAGAVNGPLALEDLLSALGREPVIGTSSVRRVAQLSSVVPGARFEPVRGNLETRLRKLDSGGYRALVLAAAGLSRLQYAKRISALLPVRTCVPAPGQGIIAVEVRRDDARVQQTVRSIDDAATSLALRAERAVVARLGGGCQMPLGAYAELDGDRLRVAAIVVTLDGARAARASVCGQADRPEQVGAEAAEELLARGAEEILAEVRRGRDHTESVER